MKTKIHSVERMKTLLKDLKSGVLTMEEFQCECAYWLLEDECWQDLQPLKLPKKPDSVYQWQNMSEEEKETAKEDFFKKHPEAEWWFEKCRYIQYTNLSRIKQLRFLKRHLPKEDEPSRRKYIVKIKQFIRQTRENEAYRKQKVPEEAKEIVEEFEGEIEKGKKRKRRSK